ncbi:hypothetical protein ACJVQT_22945 [Enterobacter huaxiensis]|nr:hypothetical protein [Enterobacter huaxiensis]MCS5452525.1 hypothetical protein [Enterobacter huaxiensis]
MKNKSGFQREKDIPASNAVRFLRWHLKRKELERNPEAKFPLPIYKMEP